MNVEALTDKELESLCRVGLPSWNKHSSSNVSRMGEIVHIHFPDVNRGYFYDLTNIKSGIPAKYAASCDLIDNADVEGHPEVVRTKISLSYGKVLDVKLCQAWSDMGRILAAH